MSFQPIDEFPTWFGLTKIDILSSLLHSYELTVIDELTVCVSLFYVNDTGSIGSRGRTVGIPYIYPPP